MDYPTFFCVGMELTVQIDFLTTNTMCLSTANTMCMSTTTLYFLLLILCILLYHNSIYSSIACHSILLDKPKFYGFRGTSINLIKHYLSNRKQCVEIDRIRSSYINISTGVPQGSILGPLLFIIYMNDLPNASRSFKCIFYADVTTLIANLNDFYAKHDSGLNINILNDELEKISYWLLVNKLSLNKLKTKFMLFHQPQKRVKIPKLKINNTLIECVDEFNYLGLIINKHLKWNSHVNKIRNKISQTISVINEPQHLIPQKTLLTIYNSLILPHINYCILAWSHDSNRILKLQKKNISNYC